MNRAPTSAATRSALRVFGLLAVILSAAACSDHLSTSSMALSSNSRVTVQGVDSVQMANLDPDLLVALRRAAIAATNDGVVLNVNSGWRSAEYQSQLLDEAIATYGSAEEAARWVATPDTSPHVSGHAVDIGDFEATTWLSQHGFEYGLCQIYANEPWHFEFRADAVDRGCPRMYADPTQDPRMHK